MHPYSNQERGSFTFLVNTTEQALAVWVWVRVWEQVNWSSSLRQAVFQNACLRREKTGGLTSPATTQAQNQAFELADSNVPPHLWTVGTYDGDEHADSKLQDLHDTGQQDFQEEPQWDPVINGVADTRGLEGGVCDPLGQHSSFHRRILIFPFCFVLLSLVLIFLLNFVLFFFGGGRLQWWRLDIGGEMGRIRMCDRNLQRIEKR